MTAAISNRRAWYILAVVIVVTFAASINRAILFLIVGPLKEELSLSDADIGVLTGLAPGILAGTGALVLGWLTDRVPRHILLGICIIFWSFATAALGVAFTFAGFLVGVLALALGETAQTPVVNSLMPDIFAGQRRIRANLIFFTAGGIASGAGSAISGLLLSWTEQSGFTLPAPLNMLSSWRVAFMLVALIGAPVALLVFTIGHVKRRSASAKEQQDYNSLSQYAQKNWVSAGGLYTAIACTSFAGLAVTSWTPAYIMRLYDADVAEVGFAIGLTTTLAALIGVISAWLIMNRLFARYGVLAPRHLYQYSMILVVIPALMQLLATSALQAYLLYGAQILMANLGIALSSTMLQDISPSQFRGRLFGISTLLITLVSSVAPFVVGLISDGFGAEPRGLLWAILIVVIPAALVAAFAIGMTNRQYEVTATNLAVN